MPYHMHILATPLQEESCQRCRQTKGMVVHKISFRFVPGRAPHGAPPEVAMCPCCDPLWTATGERPLSLPASPRPVAQHPASANVFHGAGAASRPVESDYAAALAGRKKKPATSVVAAAAGSVMHQGGPPQDVDVPMCGCGVPGKQLTVSKEGPNKGRKFFSCTKPRYLDVWHWRLFATSHLSLPSTISLSTERPAAPFSNGRTKLVRLRTPRRGPSTSSCNTTRLRLERQRLQEREW